MGYAIAIFALSRLTLSGRIELMRVNPQLFQDRSAEIGADLARLPERHILHVRGFPCPSFCRL
jgi:hypothetical protein